VTDGTTAGSQRISPVLFESGKHDLAALGETLFFSGFDSSHQETLWISDGTSAGTGPLLDRNGNPIDQPASFRVFDGLMFFSAQDGGLWQSDGTPQGTFNLRHLSPPGNSGPVQLVPAGSHLFFPAFDRNTGTELWAIDAP
jgi:ELWxxDGT repeat protein